MMNWFSHLLSISHSFELVSFYFAHVLNQQLVYFLIDVILLLSFHGLFILLITLVFKKIIYRATFKITFQTSFLPYAIVIALVILTHIGDILLLAVIVDSFKIIPDPLTTFHYVSGMYTTIGYSYTLAPEWRSLPMIISFAGLFAISISGTGLYSMLQYLVNAPNNSTNKKSN
jgi:hypothetical protein